MTGESEPLVEAAAATGVSDQRTYADLLVEANTTAKREEVAVTRVTELLAEPDKLAKVSDQRRQCKQIIEANTKTPVISSTETSTMSEQLKETSPTGETEDVSVSVQRVSDQKCHTETLIEAAIVPTVAMMSDLQTLTDTHTEQARKSEMSERQHYKEQIVEAATSSTSDLLEHTLWYNPEDTHSPRGCYCTWHK